MLPGVHGEQLASLASGYGSCQVPVPSSSSCLTYIHYVFSVLFRLRPGWFCFYVVTLPLGVHLGWFVGVHPALDRQTDRQLYMYSTQTFIISFSVQVCNYRFVHTVWACIEIITSAMNSINAQTEQTGNLQ